MDIRGRLAELLVAAMEIADHGIHGDDRLSLEGEDHPKDAVGRRVLRPHVHHEALVAAVTELDNLPRLRVGHVLYLSLASDGGAPAPRRPAAGACNLSLPSAG